MAFSFRGGIHPPYFKEKTAASIIVKHPAPLELVLPLSQHIGTPCTPLVRVGDRVLMGQKIGDSDAPVSLPIHSPVSGTVRAIEPRWHPSGIKQPAIVIENDGQDDYYEYPSYFGDIQELAPETILSLARESGIAGMGGAGFPLHLKLKTAMEKKVDTVIINGCECEPFLTADHRAMVEYPSFIVRGIQLILQCLGLHEAVIGIEDNKPDAIATMRASAEGTEIAVMELASKYPQGGEKQLIRAVTGREIPPGKLPMDIGCAVFNVDTCASLFRMVCKGTPLIKRIVTVTGPAVSTPQNLLVRLGTSYRELLEFCGLSEQPLRLISGGPMMGNAQHSLDISVVKNTSALLAFGREDAEEELDEPVCIRCGRCVAACPMRLLPNFIYMNASQGNFLECAALHVQDCIECGCCSYVCPGKLYLVQGMRMAKGHLPRQEGKK